MLTVPKDEIFEETIRLTGHRTKLASNINDFFLYADYKSSQRLRQWYMFLNEHYSHQPCIHNELVKAITQSLGEPHSLVAQQTQEELEISISLLEKVFHSPKFTEINTPEVAQYLLSILIIYSKYPGMVIGSTFKAVSHLEAVVTISQLQQVFITLFVPFENPKALTEQLHLLTLGEIHSLMLILQGTSKKAKAIPITLSRKEYNYFIKELEPIRQYSDKVLMRHCIYAKLLCINPDENFLSDFIEKSRAFRFELDLFVEKLIFWIDAYTLINSRRSDEDTDFPYFNLGNVLDYLEYQVNRHPEGQYSLNGRTLNSVVAQMNEWHRNYDREYARFHSGKKWDIKEKN